MLPAYRLAPTAAPRRQNAAATVAFAAQRRRGLIDAMALSYLVPRAVFLKEPVRESHVHPHSGAGGGQVIDDVVVAVLKADDEPVQQRVAEGLQGGGVEGQ